MGAELPKVELQLKANPPGWRQDEVCRSYRVLKCLPFYRKNPVSLIHRIREAHLHYYHGEFSHMSIRFWCGNCGFYGSKKRRGWKSYEPSLFAIAPEEHAVFCATCEGRAIGAGFDGARKINGRTVLFRPRELKINWMDRVEGRSGES